MLRIGVIGHGYWGPNLVRNFCEADGASVVTVCDTRPNCLDPVRKRYPSIAVSTSAADVLNDPSIDAVAIATPVRNHFELALQALRAGKHVLLTKPMTSTGEEAERLIEEAAARNLTLMVDHTFVYTGAVRTIRRLLDEGSLGELYYYDSVRVNLGLFQNDVDVIWDLAPHDLSILDHLTGREPRAVSATGTGHVAGQPENIAYLTLFFDGNLIAHVHVNWLAPVKIRRTLVGGSKRMVVYDDLEPSEKIKVYDKGLVLNDPSSSRRDILVGYRTGDMWSPRLDLGEALQREAAHFIDCIRTGAAPQTDGHAGLRVVRVLEAATRSMRERGRPVELATDGVAA